MRRWQKEPAEFSLLVVHSGSTDDRVAFLRDWLDRGGDLHLQAAPLDGPAPYRGSIVFAVETLPAYGLIGTWTSDPRCQVFYRNGNEQSAEDRSPFAGHYRPWFFEEDMSREPSPIPVLVAGDGSVVPITAPFVNAFETVGVTFDTRAPAEARPVSQSAAPHRLTVRLVPESSRPINPAFELARLRERILDLETQAEALEWWEAEAEFDVEMCIYVEDRRPPQRDAERGTPRWFETDTRGSVARLRQWFTSVPSAWLDEFAHARVEVDGLLALHLVVPQQEGRPPAATLPDTPWRLVLDRRWYRKHRRVFVSAGKVLHPRPPMGTNLVVTELLASALWSGRDQQDVLVVIDSANAGEHRFTVSRSAFQPLVDRAADLNFEVGIAWHEVPTTRRDYVSEVTQAAAADVAKLVAARAAVMHDALKAVWTDDRSNVQAYRDQVRDALAKIADVQALLARVARWHDEITAFQKQQRSSWTSFVHEVLKQHGHLPPMFTDARFRWLQELVAIETTLGLAASDEAASASRVAAQLRALAERMDGRRTTTPTRHVDEDVEQV